MPNELIRLLIILIILSACHNSQCVSYKGKLDIPVSSSEAEANRFSVQSAAIGSQYAESLSGSTPQIVLGGGTESAGGSRERILYSPGDPVKIKKIIYPCKEEYYPGAEIPIYVEIIPIVGELKEITIYESVDGNVTGKNDQFITINNTSPCYRLCTQKDFLKCREKAVEKVYNLRAENISNSYNNKIYSEFTNYTEPNFFTTGVDRLKLSEHLIYWYAIKLDKNGTYRTETIIRFNDGISHFADVFQPLDIIINDPDPKFDITVTHAKKHANKIEYFISSDSIEINYQIKYTGGAWDDLNNITLKFQPGDDDTFKYKYDNGTIKINNCETKNFSKNKDLNIYIKLAFYKEGSFNIPFIEIYNDSMGGINRSRKYIFEGHEIIVESWWQRNQDYLLALLAFLGLIGGKDFWGWIRRRLYWWRKIPEETHKSLPPDRLTAIVISPARIAKKHVLDEVQQVLREG